MSIKLNVCWQMIDSSFIVRKIFSFHLKTLTDLFYFMHDLITFSKCVIKYIVMIHVWNSVKKYLKRIVIFQMENSVLLFKTSFLNQFKIFEMFKSIPKLFHLSLVCNNGYFFHFSFYFLISFFIFCTASSNYIHSHGKFLSKISEKVTVKTIGI